MVLVSADLPHVRRSLVRAAVGSLLAVPAGAVWGSFATFLVFSFALATIPLSYVELSLPAALRKRVWIHIAFWMGALAIVVAAALETAYAHGVYRSHSLAGGLEGIATFVGEMTAPAEFIGYLTIAIAVAFAAGIAVSLWAPFAARLLASNDMKVPFGSFVFTLTAACLGVPVAGVVVGIGTAVVFGEPSPVVLGYACGIVGMAALPGTIALPFVHSIADAIDRAVWP